MKSIVAIAIAAAFFAFPAAAQNATKGKSNTAPGQTGLTPGQEKPDQGVRTGPKPWWREEPRTGF